MKIVALFCLLGVATCNLAKQPSPVPTVTMTVTGAWIDAAKWIDADPAHRSIVRAAGTSLEPWIHTGNLVAVETAPTNPKELIGKVAAWNDSKHNIMRMHYVIDVKGDSAYFTSTTQGSDGWVKLSDVKWVAVKVYTFQ